MATDSGTNKAGPRHFTVDRRLEFAQNEGRWYADTVGELVKNPGCIGFHLCGAYQRNKARRYGLLDEQEKPDQENVELIRAANEKVSQWMAEQF